MLKFLTQLRHIIGLRVVMGTSIGVIECPFCSEILEVRSPDTLHTAFSTVKPIPKSYYAKVIVKKNKCQNPQCKKPIAIYWYAPLEYFSRI
jgi:hypothetical protein